MVAKELAKAVLATAKLYEESFDKKEAAKLRAEYELKLNEAKGYNIALVSSPNPDSCYKLTLQEAAEKSSGELTQPVYLLLSQAWNDAIDWAKTVQ